MTNPQELLVEFRILSFLSGRHANMGIVGDVASLYSMRNVCHDVCVQWWEGDESQKVKSGVTFLCSTRRPPRFRLPSGPPWRSLRSAPVRRTGIEHQAKLAGLPSPPSPDLLRHLDMHVQLPTQHRLTNQPTNVQGVATISSSEG